MKYKYISIIIIFFLILYVLSVFILSFIMSPISNNSKIINKNIEEHFYTITKNKQDVLQLEEMITYVLFPRKITSKKVQNRYRDLLNSIINNIDEISLESNLTIWKLKRINRFVIPIKEDTYKVHLSNYNYELSKGILDYLRKKLDYKMFKGEGPYLITTRSKIFSNNKIESILYLNLSRFDESAIVETVKIYMNRLEDSEKIEFSLLDNLKFAILDHVVDVSYGIEKIVQIINPPVHAKEN